MVQVVESSRGLSPSIRTTITIPRELDNWLREVSEARAVPKAILIRMLLLSCRDREAQR